MVKDGESLQPAKTRLGANCGSDHQLLTANFRFKSKKVGKTTRPFRYDLYQISYDYIVKVTNRFKGLGPQSEEKEMQKAKKLSEENLQTAEERRQVEGKGEKERYTHLNKEFKLIATRDKKAFLSEQCKETEENNRMGKLEISSRKLEILREHFM